MSTRSRPIPVRLTTPTDRPKRSVRRVRVIARIVGALFAVLLAAGCTTVVAGSIQPAPGLVPQPVTGQTLRKALPETRQVSNMLDEQFQVDSRMPPRFGGIDDMATGVFGSPNTTARECGGVVAWLQQPVYRDSNVRNFTDLNWTNTDSVTKRVDAVLTGVVAFGTAADASALFVKFSQQWDQCNGKTVTVDTRQQGVLDSRAITDVRVTDSVLAAQVRLTIAHDGRPPSTMLLARALGVRVNCIVEVELFILADYKNTMRYGTVDPDTSPTDIAHLMMDKVSDLS